MTTMNQTTQTSGYSTVGEYRNLYPESFGCGVANARNMTVKGVIANFGAVETYDCGVANRTSVLSRFGQKVTDTPTIVPSRDTYSL